MSIRLSMHQTAQSSSAQLGISRDTVVEFLQNQINPDGGFKNRNGKSDLYYTLFGLESILALRDDWHEPRVENYLNIFQMGDALDFVDLCCLIRCLTILPHTNINDELRDCVGNRMETYRTDDGGFHPEPNAQHGTVYACFLGLGIYQDLNIPLPYPDRLAQCLHSLENKDGGFANEHILDLSSTPATAAAVAILCELRQPTKKSWADWLLNRFHPDGGFRVIPHAPVSDLLSTATALHALSKMTIPFDSLRENCLDFLDTLWNRRGGFYGNQLDSVADCEYTFYGLLSLGHLR